MQIDEHRNSLRAPRMTNTASSLTNVRRPREISEEDAKYFSLENLTEEKTRNEDDKTLSAIVKSLQKNTTLATRAHLNVLELDSATSKLGSVSVFVDSKAPNADIPGAPSSSPPANSSRSLHYRTIVNPSNGLTYKVPIPNAAAENRRLADLKQYNVVDTEPEPIYDDLTTLAAKICNVPISCVSFIDETRQFFKSHYGLPVNQTPRDLAFCDHVCQTGQLLEVEDASRDDRFQGNPLVTDDPNIRFYAGVPLVSTEGNRLGAFCVIDRKPRKLNDEQKASLLILAKQVQAELQFKLTISRLQEQVELTDKLLLNILPVGIIDRLKSYEGSKESSQGVFVADSYDCATIIFIDIVGFTRYASNVTPRELVKTLGSMFCKFDRLCAQHGITKIKTVGDGYMAVGGVPDFTPDHAQRVVSFALDVIEVALPELNDELNEKLEVRIGINSGPLIAGVVGTEKFTYDCFGDSVNIASRLENAGTAGKIHISESTYNLVKDSFICESAHRGITLKGKDAKIETYFVEAPIMK